MPKSITFFSRGKTPIYVNYVIAHNNVGAPFGIWMFLPVNRMGNGNHIILERTPYVAPLQKKGPSEGRSFFLTSPVCGRYNKSETCD